MAYRYFVLFLCYFCTFSLTFAATIPVNLVSPQSSDTSITLDWDDVEGALGYYVYYDTQLPENNEYAHEVVDLVEMSEYILPDLSPGTQYYIAVTSIDDLGTESDKSEHLIADTAPTGEVVSSTQETFRISEVEIVDDVTLDVMFTQPLDASPNATQEFLIVDTTSGNEMWIDLTQVDPNNPNHVLILLSSSLTPNTKYDITVLDIRDAQENSIEDGINAFLNFTTPSSFSEETPDLTSAPEEDWLPEEDVASVEEDPVEQPIEETSWQNTSSANAWNAWSMISQEELDTNVTKAGENAEKLPQTGPEHWLIAFIAILLAGWIFMYQRTKLQK